MSQIDSAPKLDRQREHQANERTFLAWLRTSIAMMSFGFVIARFGLFLREMGLVLARQEPPLRSVINSQNVGVALIVLGVAATVGAAWRYEQVYAQIERGDFKPTRRWVWLVTAIVFALGVLIVPFLLVDLPAPVAAPAPKRIGHK